MPMSEQPWKELTRKTQLRYVRECLDEAIASGQRNYRYYRHDIYASKLRPANRWDVTVQDCLYRFDLQDGKWNLIFSIESHTERRPPCPKPSGPTVAS